MNTQDTQNIHIRYTQDTDLNQTNLKDGLAFYLQDAYVREWIDNSMIFLEVEDVDAYWNELLAMDLTLKYEGVKLSPVQKYDWGIECYLHDPSGILWHFGEFFK